MDVGGLHRLVSSGILLRRLHVADAEQRLVPPHPTSARSRLMSELGLVRRERSISFYMAISPFCRTVVGLVVLTGALALADDPPALPAFPPLTGADRIVVVAPHPDDDVLGAGGLIQQALAV